MKSCGLCRNIKEFKFVEDADGHEYRPDILKIKNDSINGYVFFMGDRDFLPINFCPVCGRMLNK